MLDKEAYQFKKIVTFLKSVLGVAILCLASFLSIGQHQNIPINFDVSQKIERNIQVAGELTHTAIKPFVQTFVSDSVYASVFMDTNVYYYDFTQKLFKENLLNIHQKELDLVCDPLFNVVRGNTYFDDSTQGIYHSTRGVRVVGNITSKFSFETRFYESQIIYPAYLDSIVDERGVALGLGRAKEFQEVGRDVGMSSGYISYSPIKTLNIQLGQGKHFFGNGYRSMLLSDNAFNYPYLSFTWSLLKGKLLYKNINAWMQTLERIPVASTPEALYKTKNGSFRYLSFKPNKVIELGVFEGVIYRHYVDSVGEVSPHASFYVPIIGVSSLTNSSVNENKVLLGLNVNVNIAKSIQIYGQFVVDDFNKTGYQLGARWRDVLKIKNTWLQLEYNSASSYLYANTTENLIQNYSHSNQELAHPIGASFNEIIAMAHFEKERWFCTGKFFMAQKTRMGGGTFGENIFLPNDAIIPAVAPEKINWKYYGCDFGYNLNIKTKMQIYGTVYNRNEGGNQEWYWLLGFRTNLNNYYHEL